MLRYAEPNAGLSTRNATFASNPSCEPSPYVVPRTRENVSRDCTPASTKFVIGCVGSAWSGGTNMPPGGACASRYQSTSYEKPSDQLDVGRDSGGSPTEIVPDQSSSL